MSSNVALDVIQDEIRLRAIGKEQKARRMLVRTIRQTVIDYVGKSVPEWEEMAIVVGALAASSAVKWFNTAERAGKPMYREWVRSCATDTLHDRRHAIEKSITEEMMGNLLKRR